MKNTDKFQLLSIGKVTRFNVCSMINIGRAVFSLTVEMDSNKGC